MDVGDNRRIELRFISFLPQVSWVTTEYIMASTPFPQKIKVFQSLVLVSIMGLFTPFVVQAQMGSSASDQPRPTSTPTPPIVRGDYEMPLIASPLSIPRSPWPQSMSWQAAPDGKGEFFVFPHPGLTNTENALQWDKRLVVGTVEGLLQSEDKKTWHIVPGLYGCAVRPVRAYNGLLWVEVVGQGMVGLNRQFKIVRRFPLAEGRCVAMTPHSFWCLDTFFDTGWIGEEATTLTEYDWEGHKEHRFITNPDDLGISTSSGHEERGWPQTGIYWVGIDTKNIWIATNNYRGTGPGPGDGPSGSGNEQFGVIDRKSGLYTKLHDSSVSSYLFGVVAKHFFNFPHMVQWLEDGNVYQLDKATRKISLRGPLVAKGYRLQDVTGYNIKGQAIDAEEKWSDLWFIADDDKTQPQFVSYSRETLKPIAPGKIGQSPFLFGASRFGISSYSLRPLFLPATSPFWSGILAADEHTLWLGTTGPSLLMISDDGQQTNYDVKQVMPQREPAQVRVRAVATKDKFFWGADGDMICSCPQGSWRLYLPGSYDALTAGQGRLWVGYPQYEISTRTSLHRLLTLSADSLDSLSLQNAGSQSSLSGASIMSWDMGNLRQQFMGAQGDSLYLKPEIMSSLATAAPQLLMRADAASKALLPVESWEHRFANAEERDKFNKRLVQVYAVPDGRVAFDFKEERQIKEGPFLGYSLGDVTDKARRFMHDVKTDQWSEVNSEGPVLPLPAGKLLFGYREHQLYQWRGDNWELVGNMPLYNEAYLRQLVADTPNVASTQKYFYEETALGIYRIPWSQIGH